ncbi:hypothetical protein ACJ73_00832 [Blastomyces percursus]|uniref:Uncharacterized protein n=1 Tax=Blastomyces percursus TaxID=1658174 RepID=A0A1J9QI42_9EURO|nr:hypothetical protein ACJ73_00832 [Blastomyces percursus]
MKFLVVFLTIMTSSVWAVAIPAPEPQPAVEKPKEGEYQQSSRNVGVLAPVKVVSGLQPTTAMDCAIVDLDFQASGPFIFFAL